MLCSAVSNLQDSNGRWVDAAITVLPTGTIIGKDARAYMDSQLFSWSFRVWRTWKDLGVLPHGMGTQHERPIVLWALQTWEEIRGMCEKHMIEKMKK